MAREKWKRGETRSPVFSVCVTLHFQYTAWHYVSTINYSSATPPISPMSDVLCFLPICLMIFFLIPLENSMPPRFEGFYVPVNPCEHCMNFGTKLWIRQLTCRARACMQQDNHDSILGKDHVYVCVCTFVHMYIRVPARENKFSVLAS